MKTIKLKDDQVDRLIKLLNRRIVSNQSMFGKFTPIPFVETDSEIEKEWKEKQARSVKIVTEYKAILKKLGA